ncbi:polyisoprenoid-binding protein [Roseobacter denitrificans]|uniref:YceI-like family protein n=1 Tax=Roseobacter denitrificans (strain ATCC 33942 / OCh 114) TaxID=375451 RepID=Q167B7_ROSDO|nr:YceI family protein [Roseobacter denitrificans]ABG31926.1 YceI-like family protein [Roseobacter denitrificans OCh 114]AVL54693.1 polyisoprenoid-binding protein [Roseobacter denitrificans]SFG48155.1 Polyisoprenoid-binding protein YceI [Roseobacter denitrificans OCh 114]
MRILTCTAVATAIFGTTALAEPARFELDPSHTAVFFTVDHIGYAKTLGIFGTVSGEFTYDMETQDLSDVRVSIDAASVNTFDDARDGHVRNKDFLDVSNHPEITFVATGGTPTSDTAGTVTGDLTILGQTRPVTLDVTLNKAAEYPFGHKRMTLGLSIEASIERSDFGMTYAVGNGLVGDRVDIQIETEAMKMD